jgi:hypothetical protein
MLTLSDPFRSAICDICRTSLPSIVETSEHVIAIWFSANFNNKSISISSISIGDKMKLQIIGTGNVKMAIMIDGKGVKRTIENVLHVPSLGYNLLSVGAMESKGMTASFGGGVCSIFAASKKIAQ